MEGPETAVVPLGSIANFSCTAVGYVFWEVNGAQVTVPSQQNLFAASAIHVPFSTQNHSIVTVNATASNNGSNLTCLVERRPGALEILSRTVTARLIAYGK